MAIHVTVNSLTTAPIPEPTSLALWSLGLLGMTFSDWLTFISDPRHQIPQAVQALAEWKALFAEHVAVKAKELAEKSGSAGVITLGHYRRAATIAVQMLATAVQGTDSSDGRQEAA